MDAGRTVNRNASLRRAGCGLAARPVLWMILVLAAAAPGLAAELTPAQIENRRCFNCHGQEDIAKLGSQDRLTMVDRSTGVATAGPASAPAGRGGLFVTDRTLAGTVHAGLACTDCHAAAKTLPHLAKLGPASCDSKCHIKNQSDYMQGAHAEALAKGDKNAPTCTTCHGGHDILPKPDRRSTINPLNIVKICGGCHQLHQTGQDNKQHVQQYLDSVHGRALVNGGLAVSATCADCHGSHRVLPPSNPDSLVNRAKVPLTCGRCHIGLSDVYQASVHGKELAKGNLKAPACTDCHTAHAITRTNVPAFKLDMVNECGHCHELDRQGRKRKTSLYDTYRLSYHGQVTSLGFTRGARCSDCHGAHNIQRVDDPASRLSQANRVDTCRKCHPNATASFAKFEAHADFRDGERYPVLHAVWIYFVIMMSLAFGFFGMHSVLWLIRSVIERIRHGRRPHHAGGPAIRRFTGVDRLNHSLMAMSFFGLTLTGLPLLYADLPWARALANFLGGVPGAGMLHRGFAIMLFINFLIHFAGVAQRFRWQGVRGTRKALFGPTSLLPRIKDVKDCMGMFRWFLLGGEKPKFDRWAYWEKFDYFAEVGGSVIIGTTGLLLWFPQFFAQYLPGWIFNVATLIHGYEALLAIVFIFTVHFFNANLRLGKFPVDDVIFTGQMPEEEFKEERASEYEYLKARGDLDSYRVAPAPSWWRKLSVTVGVSAMSVGLALATLIILVTLKVI